MKKLKLDIGRKNLDLKCVTGKLLDIRSWREHSGVMKVEFWVKDETDGVEHCFRLNTADVQVAQGQRVSVVTGTTGVVTDKVVYIYNWNARTRENWLTSALYDRLGFRYGGWTSFGKALPVFLAMVGIEDYLFSHFKLFLPSGLAWLALLGAWGYFFSGVRKFRSQLPKAVEQVLPQLMPRD